MSSETATKTRAVAADAFPAQQSVIEPDAGTGNVSLYLDGAGTYLNLYFDSEGSGAQVFYGENSTYPNTPLPQGVTQYPLANGFNLRWTSDGTPFKVVWGVS